MHVHGGAFSHHNAQLQLLSTLFYLLQEFKSWQDIYWQVPLSLVLISIKWWENYVDRNRCTAKLFELKKEIQRVRVKMSVITSLWGITFTIGFLYFLEYLQVLCLSSLELQLMG